MSTTLSKQTIEDLKARLKSLPKLADIERPARTKKAKEDFFYAVQTYFPHQIDFTKKETSKFRKFVYENIDGLTIKERKITFEAYRGGAKTTLLTRLHTLWRMAIRTDKKHGAIISSTIDVAKESLDFIKTELEDNEALISDFDIITGDKLGESWTTEEIIFSVGGTLVRIKVYGAGKKIRGANWRGIRPDLIVCDDIENDENVESKAFRDKLLNWFKKAIMKLPARKSTTYNIIFVGTKLHHDSLLSNLQERNDFASFKFPLVLQFPNNIDDLNKKALKKSDAKGMVLDDQSLDAFELLKEYLEDKDSFMSEFQNQPLSRDGLTFSDYITVSEIPICDAYTLGIDPALGKSAGDYFAITILGMVGTKCYITTKMYKLKATLMIDKIIQIYLEYYKYNRPIKIAIEEVQFQEFFKDVLADKAKTLGIVLPIVPLKNTVPKELRIDSIAPHINSGDFLIDEQSLLLIDELDTYPKSAHDDGLDSVEMAWRIAKKPAFSYADAQKHLNKINEKAKLLQRLRK